MIITDKAQIKIAELRESNNLRLSGSDELECYELIESDLKLPADATFTRSSVAYLSDGRQVPANTPRFEPGKFGKAIMVEEGTENIHHEKLYRDLSASYLKVTDVERDGFTRCKRFERIAEGNAYFTVDIPCLPNTAYTLTFWIRGVNLSPDSYVNMYLSDNTQSSEYHSIYGLTDEFKKFTVTRITSESATKIVRASLHFGYNNIKVGEIIEVADWQLEAKPYATSFTDSIRSPETLTIPTAGVLNPQEGTVECWVKVPIVTNWNNFFRMDGLSNGRFLLYFTTDGRAAFDYGPSNTGPVAPAGTIEANNWYYIALRWSATTGKQALFINGVKYEKDLPNGVATSFPSTVSVVNNYSAYIDDLRISNRARTDEEILAAYQSGKPLPVDEWTTYKLDFDDKVRITTQGQIICNELIEI